MEQEVIDSIVLESLNDLSLIKRKYKPFPKLLSKTNPFDLAIKCKTAQEIVDFILTKHIQTSRETIMGHYLESIGLKICDLELNGFKSKEECTDMEWGSDGKKHYRGWKSSPCWANSDQKRAVNTKLKELETNQDFGSFKVLTAYGKSTQKKTTKGFLQLSGQDSWEEISGDSNTHNKVMVSMLKNSETIELFLKNLYNSDISKAVEWINNNFTNVDNTINFIKINDYVSSRNKIKVTKW
jgi:hypothetical protein